MDHPFHEKIVKLVQSAFESNYEIVVDYQCMNGSSHRQQIPLFCCSEKSSKHEFCCVDALIISKQSEKIKVIIEIEEIKAGPTTIFGKFYSSAFSSHYIHDRERGPIAIDGNAAFVQVVQFMTPSESRSKKLMKIEEFIQKNIPSCSKIRHYRLLYGCASDFENHGTVGEQLILFISQKLLK